MAVAFIDSRLRRAKIVVQILFAEKVLPSAFLFHGIRVFRGSQK